jgi:hypothetical protein
MRLAFLYGFGRRGCGFHGNLPGPVRGVGGAFCVGNAAVLLAGRMRGMPRMMAWHCPHRVYSPRQRPRRMPAPRHWPLSGMEPPMTRCTSLGGCVNVPMPVDMPPPQGMHMAGSVGMPVGAAVSRRRPVPVGTPMPGNAMAVAVMVGMPLFVHDPLPRRMPAMMPMVNGVVHSV